MEGAETRFGTTAAARALPWLLCLVLLGSFIAAFIELQRMRARFGEITQHSFHDHAEVRLQVIRSALSQEREPIVILGDSLAELAQFPGGACGKPIINAGIGGATLSELAKLADELSRASLVVVLAGTNDAGSATFEEDYSRLLAQLPSAIAVPATAFPKINQQIVAAAKRSNVPVAYIEFAEFNGIHPTPSAYRSWTERLVASLSGECAR